MSDADEQETISSLIDYFLAKYLYLYLSLNYTLLLVVNYIVVYTPRVIFSNT